ncbi:unnamed protein product, partial [Trichogramma brassicae]
MALRRKIYQGSLCASITAGRRDITENTCNLLHDFNSHDYKVEADGSRRQSNKCTASPELCSLIYMIQQQFRAMVDRQQQQQL